MADDLTPSESALLIVLMSEAREIPNAELKDRYHIDLKKPSREKLNRLRLIESRSEGRTFVHELADAGWVAVQKDLDFDSPRARALGSALAVLHGNLRDRVLQRTEFVSFGELFARPDLDARIRSAYALLAVEPKAWVSLTRLRAAFTDVARTDLDAALRKLERASDVNIVPESNRKTLTAEDQAAALRIGGQDKHLLAIGV
jgi:hypothetical protein